jgi:hypothetical protein
MLRVGDLAAHEAGKCRYWLSPCVGRSLSGILDVPDSTTGFEQPCFGLQQIVLENGMSAVISNPVADTRALRCRTGRAGGTDRSAVETERERIDDIDREAAVVHVREDFDSLRTGVPEQVSEQMSQLCLPLAAAGEERVGVAGSVRNRWVFQMSRGGVHSAE